MRNMSRPTTKLLRVVPRLALATVVSGALFQAAPLANADHTAARARTVLRNAAGQEVGRATFTQRGAKVVVAAEAQRLPPGFHGFHVHTIGRCDPPGFVSAGGHLNPSGQPHAEHAGDLPSLLVNEDGTAQLRVTTDRFRVADLLAGTGTALIVHANRDNFANIPTRYAPAPDAMTLETGDAGARLACGVIESGRGRLLADETDD